MDPVLSDLLIFQYSEQKAPKALLTDSAIVSPRLYLNKNRERHFLILKECTRNFCANNVNQMHKGNFIKYRTHSSLKWHFSYQGTDIHIGDHQILHKLGNFGQNNVVEIIIMNGVTEYVIHRLFSGQSTRFHN